MTPPPGPLCPSDGTLCEDCPPVGYPTDKTRCDPCPRRSPDGINAQVREAISRIRPLPGTGPNFYSVDVDGWGLSAPTTLDGPAEE